MSHKYEHRTRANTWVVVADRGKARIFSTVWPGMPRLEEIAGHVHPEARLHVRDTISDGPGSFRQKHTAPHSGDPHTDFPHRMAEDFAQRVTNRLESGRMKGSFGHLVLVASPLMLAALRKQMHRPLKDLVVEEIDSDFTELTPAEVRDRLAQRLTSATA